LATCVILHERITLYTMKKTTIFLSLLFAASSLYAQIDNTYQAEDDRQRGWYNRPWQRYEAENGKCQTNGSILSATFDNSQLQSEATNQIATNLINKGDYIQWTCGKEANAMTIRFSLPDNATTSKDGTGTQGNLSLYVNNQKVNIYQATRNSSEIVSQNKILLDSYWAWQYFNRENVAYEKIKGNILRMRFDEIIIRLENPIKANDVFKLVKEDDNSTAYTIDFVELENVSPITYESIDGQKVKYEGNGSDLQTFINNNSGKTIYLPAGKYIVPERIYFKYDNTKLQGAGIFYTEVFFSAPLDNTNYAKRGFESSKSNIKVDGMYINGILNQRYYQRNSGKQPGKGFNASFGTNSTISNVLVQHFECGAWFDNANQLHISNSRFRNNYADGTNLASASKNCIVEFCSYRNNGDDDMAAWSNGGLGENITYQYNTSELCWRAAGIGFFGGKQHKAHHCLVIDPIEIGIRIDASFGGYAFSNDGFIEIFENSVYKGGTDKNVWGNHYEGAIYVTLTSAQYDIPNISFKNIDIINSKENAISINNYNSSTKNLRLCFENININGVNQNNTGNKNGLYISSDVRGTIFVKNFTFSNVTGQNIKNDAPTSKLTFKETQDDPCNFTGYYTITVNASKSAAGTVTGSGFYKENSNVTITATPKTGYTFDMWDDGNKSSSRNIVVTQDSTFIANFKAILYTLTAEPNDTVMGKVEGGGVFEYGTFATLTATPKEGYKFEKWDNNIPNNPYKVKVLQNETYTAIFVKSTDALNDPDSHSTIIYSQGKNIIIENPNNKIEIIDTIGHVIYSSKVVSNETTSIPMPFAGIYIVKVGNKATKLIIQ